MSSLLVARCSKDNIYILTNGIPSPMPYNCFNSGVMTTIIPKRRSSIDLPIHKYIRNKEYNPYKSEQRKLELLEERKRKEEKAKEVLKNSNQSIFYLNQ